MPPEPGQGRRWQRLMSAAQEEVDAVLRAMPEPLRREAAKVPVTFEPAPSAEIQAEGFEPDLLGLFVGEAFNEKFRGDDPLPAQVILFLGNLWDFAESDAGIYREEVRRTYLHEIGHYLGLDEDDLYDRDLD